MSYFNNGRAPNMTHPNSNVNGLNYLDQLKIQVK